MTRGRGLGREDRYTRTEADAGAFEDRYGPVYDDDTPTLAELEADEARAGDEEDD